MLEQLIYLNVQSMTNFYSNSDCDGFHQASGRKKIFHFHTHYSEKNQNLCFVSFHQVSKSQFYGQFYGQFYVYMKTNLTHLW